MPGTFWTTCAIAAFSESPASTLIVRRSRVSESVRRISFCLSSTRRFNMESGATNPTNPSNPNSTIRMNGVTSPMTDDTTRRQDDPAHQSDDLEREDALRVPPRWESLRTGACARGDLGHRSV